MNESYKQHSLTNSSASSTNCSAHSFMKTAVIYARYSSDNQTEQSIEGQLRVCEEYAKSHDILILNTYIDRAMTGTNDNRPDFQQMIEDSAKKEFEYVVVYKIDRFSRNKYETAKYKKILKDNGVKLISAMENIPDTPEGIILESLLEGMAEYYSAELSQKVKRGMNETRLKGNFTGGNILYGYKVENHKVLIDEEKAEIVRYIYKQYSLGMYVKDIIDNLTKNHILIKGKPFAKNTIYTILKNEKYSGIYRFKNEIYTNMYPQIVPTEIYEKVRNKININKYGKRSTETVYLLRHKLTCGYCGMPISAECGTAKNGTKKHYYKCLGRKRHNGCQKSMIRKDILENFILTNILEVLKDKEFVDSIVDSIYNIQQTSTSSNLNNLLTEQKQIEATLNNIMKAIELGVVNNTTNSRMKELENSLDELNKQILIEKSKTLVKLTKEEIKEFYIDALKLEPKMLIDYTIKNIKLYEDKIEITFNSPLKISPNTQGLFLFTRTKQMPRIIQNAPTPRMIDMQIKYFVHG